MAMLLKFFKKQCLPTNSEVDLPDTVTRGVNDAMRSALEEERNRANGRKQKYTHFTPEARVKIAKYAARCGNAAAVKHFFKEFDIVLSG